jgi:hypothetical protein
MQQKYKVLSFAIVAALYIFLVPLTSSAQTHVPNTFAGAKVCGGTSWTLGCDRIPLNGQPATAEVCENLYEPHNPHYDIIQATGGYCYYYKDGTSSGRGGPNMWRYASNEPNQPNTALRAAQVEAAVACRGKLTGPRWTRKADNAMRACVARSNPAWQAAQVEAAVACRGKLTGPRWTRKADNAMRACVGGK